MNINFVNRSAAVVIFLLIGILVSGCARSPKPRLYVFSTGGDKEQFAARHAADTAYTVRFKALRLPRYIDRPQIVSRVSPGEVYVDEFNRWGIPLTSSLTRELALVLMVELPDAYVDINPWLGQKDTDYLVSLDIIHLDGDLGGTVLLEAHWSVYAPGKPEEPVTRKLTHHQRASADKSYESYVEAMRLTMDDLGKEISGAIRERRK